MSSLEPGEDFLLTVSADIFNAFNLICQEATREMVSHAVGGIKVDEASLQCQLKIEQAIA